MAGVAGPRSLGAALPAAAPAKMDQISASGEVDQMQLLELQFAMGQYNAKLETISSVTKSIQDMLKSLAQRTG